MHTQPPCAPPDSSKGLRKLLLFRSPLVLYKAQTRRINEAEAEIPPGWQCTKPYVSLDESMNDPGGILGASHSLAALAPMQCVELLGFHWARGHMTLGGLLSNEKSPQAGSAQNDSFHWTRSCMTLGGFPVHCIRMVWTHSMTLRDPWAVWIFLSRAPFRSCG